MKLHYKLLGQDSHGDYYRLCYTNSPKHTIRYYLRQGWQVSQLSLEPIISKEDR